MAKKECVSCGNVGNLSHCVKIGTMDCPVCGSCLGEAKKLLFLSPDDPPATVAAKFLALRNPHKENAARNRMSLLEANIPWSEVDRQVEFLRKLAQKRREETAQELAAKNRRWLDELEEFLEREVDARGLEWDLDEWVRTGRKTYVIKIGIYPWGKTFLEGTLEEIQDYVLEIAESTLSKRWKCPFCGTKIDWRRATGLERCVCGARFRQSHMMSYGGAIHDNDAWEEIEDRLRASVKEEKWSLYETLLESGAYIEDLFGGVAYLGKVFGWPAYALRGKLCVKPVGEITKRGPNSLRLALAEAGFTPQIRVTYYGRLDWWKGKIGGIPVNVCPFHPGHGGVAVYADVWSVPLRKEWDDHLHDEFDIFNRWADWLTDNGSDGVFQVTGSIDVSKHEACEGFIWQKAYSNFQEWPDHAPDEWMKILRCGLEVYKAKVSQFMAEERISLPAEQAENL